MSAYLIYSQLLYLTVYVTKMKFFKCQRYAKFGSRNNWDLFCRSESPELSSLVCPNKITERIIDHIELVCESDHTQHGVACYRILLLIRTEYTNVLLMPFSIISFAAPAAISLQMLSAWKMPRKCFRRLVH